MLKTNKDVLPIISVQGAVSSPIARGNGARINPDGHPEFFPGTGGIIYNIKIGDNAVKWVGDHLEPGVSSKNSDADKNGAYMLYSCVGNEATIVSGDAKGAKGFVVGKHGGIDHVMIHFDDATLEKLLIDDKIQVKACGQGMKLDNHPDVVLRSLSPELLDKMNITEKDGKLQVGVAKIAPAAIMGSGLGHVSTASGDYDITLHDKEITKQYGLDELRFGDIVAITDADNRIGRNYMTGAMTIGVISHSDCCVPGHGPGVTTLMSALDGKIEVFIDPKANLKDMFL